MPEFDLGVVLWTMEDAGTRETPRWSTLKQQALLAEEAGFNTVWVADELQWESDDFDGPRGWWECGAIAGALAASTSTIGVGTWVLSALHRNPGLIVKTAETLDEISGGRFIFGLGSGHAGRQGEAFGFPPNYTVSRYEEALSIITALRADKTTTQIGTFHTAKAQVLAPLGPSGANSPLMLAGHGERTMTIAANNADIWSGFATASSQPEAFKDMLAQLDGICAEVGRDPGTLGRSIGIFVSPPGSTPLPQFAGEKPLAGSVEEIAEALVRFKSMGFTRVEIMSAGATEDVIGGLAPVLDEIRSA
ncbi:MAG: LLM class flavin-dependent oxidoreductase [Acidimicrobiia bacterium]